MLFVCLYVSFLETVQLARTPLDFGHDDSFVICFKSDAMKRIKSSVVGAAVAPAIQIRRLQGQVRVESHPRTKPSSPRLVDIIELDSEAVGCKIF